MEEGNRRFKRQKCRRPWTGEALEVNGGGIDRSTGRKDRHSKMVTVKGLRDRRLRFSDHTAIQFLDVQDRLGYDRPSKAVDWLIQNAKVAIDQLMPPPTHGHGYSYEEGCGTPVQDEYVRMVCWNVINPCNSAGGMSLVNREPAPSVQ